MLEIRVSDQVSLPSFAAREYSGPAGLIAVASEAEAEAGTAVDKVMTPLRTAQAVRARLSDRADIRDQDGVNGLGDNDDQADVQTILNQAGAAGAKLHFPGDFVVGLGSSIVWPNHGKIIGGGSGQYPASIAAAANAPFLDLPRTEFRALAGYTGSYMVELATPSGVDYTYQGLGLEGVMLNCNSQAQGAILTRSIKHSKVKDVLVLLPTSRGITQDHLVGTVIGTAQAGGASTMRLQASNSSTRDDWYNGLSIETTGGTGSGQTRTISDYVGATQDITVSVAWSVTPDATTTYTITGTSPALTNGTSQFNLWEQITVWAGQSGTAEGWRLRGDCLNDVNTDTYIGIKIVTADGNCFVIEVGDNNRFYAFDTYNFGTGVGLVLFGNEKNLFEFARYNTWYSAQLVGPGTAGVLSRAGAAQNALYNTIYDYNTGNGPPEPTIQTGSVLRYFPASGVTGIGWRAFTPTITFATPGDVSTSYSVQVGKYKLTNNGTLKFSIWLTFTPTHTTASGDFSIEGLPFAAKGISGATGWGAVVHGVNAAFTWGASRTELKARVLNNSTQIKLVGQGSGVASAFLTSAEMTSGTAKIVNINGEYEVAV